MRPVESRFFILLAGGIVLAAILTSCAQELANPEVDITSVRCNIAQIDTEEDFATGIVDTLPATKATFSNNSFLWSAGDRIGIVPNSGAQIYFEVDEGAGTSTASFDGGSWAMKATETFYAYYPLYQDMFLSKDQVPVDYTGQTQNGNNNNLHTGDFWTLYTTGTTAVGNVLNFSFNHLTSFFKTYVTVPAGTYTRITFSAPSDVFIQDGYFDLSAQTPAIVGTTMTDELSLDLQNVTFADETELTGYLVLAPVDITGIPITVTVYKDGTATYEYTLTKASPMVAAKTYAFRATSLTQLAASAAQANALFAAGATAVTITEPLTDNATIVLPDTNEAVTLNLPTTASTSTLTVAYDQGAASHPATLAITGPEGADLDIRTPNSTVTLNGIAYDQVTSRTAANTCIIPAGVTVNNLKVVQGGVQVFGTVTQIDLSEQEDDAIISVSGTVSSLLGEDDEEYVPATGVTLSQSSINLNVGATETLTATVAPAGAYPNVIWTSSDETVATVSASGVVTAVAAGSTTITAKTISGGFTATCNVSVIETIGGHEYVDLGLSVLWATYNVGASSPEEFGDYYAWGETEAKSSYQWGNYKYRSNGSLSKYNNTTTNGVVDNMTVLEAMDDIARTSWGSNWRIPTLDEGKELLNNCTWEFNTINNIVGITATSRINGKSVFFPLAGYWDYNSLAESQVCGRYWLSSVCTSTGNCDSEHSYRISFRSISTPSHDWDWFDRYAGLSIRPVYGSVAITSIALNHSSISLSVGESVSLAVTLTPSNATTPLVWISSDSNVVTVDSSGRLTCVGYGNCTITVRTSDGSKSANCSVSCLPNAVDLGLSVKWAPCNLGAVRSEDYGDHYAWGETETKNSYSWSNYKWCNGTYNSLTKYNSTSTYGVVDNKVALEAEDDVVRVKWQGNWRMPTYSELEELTNTNNCSWIWTTINGTSGYKVTSKKTGYTDKWIFLPAAGIYAGSLNGLNSSGSYWGSTRGGGNESDALLFDEDDIDADEHSRYCGYSIRPVID